MNACSLGLIELGFSARKDKEKMQLYDKRVSYLDWPLIDERYYCYFSKKFKKKNFFY